LVEHYLRQLNRDAEHPPISVSKEALAIMMDYEWPGNVRQLQNVLQYAIVKSNGRMITPEHLPAELGVLDKIALRRGPAKKLDLASVLAALEKTGHNKAKAARRLGVGRATLYRFLNEHPEAEAFIA
jgi:DNA-binding NtrC family response regulator